MKPDAVLSFSDHHMKEQAIMEGVTKDVLFELAKKGNRTYSFKKSKATYRCPPWCRSLSAARWSP